MTEKEKRIRQIAEQLEQNPKFVADAIMWLLKHPVLTDGICNPDDRLSDEALKREMARAVRENDYVYYALLLYQKYVQEYGKPEQEAPR